MVFRSSNQSLLLKLFITLLQPCSRFSAVWVKAALQCCWPLGVPVWVVMVVGLQPTVIASRAPHLLLEQSVMTIQRIVDVHRPSRSWSSEGIPFIAVSHIRTRTFGFKLLNSLPGDLRLCCFAIGGKRREEPSSKERSLKGPISPKSSAEGSPVGLSVKLMFSKESIDV